MRHFLTLTGWLTLFLVNASYALEQSRVDRCLLQVEVQFLENPAIISRQEKHAWKRISEISCERTGSFTSPEAFAKGSDTALIYCLWKPCLKRKDVI